MSESIKEEEAVFQEVRGQADTASCFFFFFCDEAAKVINIPTVAAAYSDEMNHVDRGNQLRSYYAYDHPLRRGPWQALCWTFLLDVTLINSYIIQLYGPQPNWKRYTTYREWRECIYNELFNTSSKPGKEALPGWRRM
jgi:hypothetical protein